MKKLSYIILIPILVIILFISFAKFMDMPLGTKANAESSDAVISNPVVKEEPKEDASTVQKNESQNTVPAKDDKTNSSAASSTKTSSKEDSKTVPKDPDTSSIIKQSKDPGMMIVLNIGETNYASVRASADKTSKILGRIYGSTVEVKVLDQKGEYAYIQGTDYNTLKTIKGYVPASMLKAVKITGPYKMVVDISEQKVYIYKDNKTLKTVSASTGIDKYDTIKGRFIIGSRGESFYSSTYAEGAYYWVRFNKGYLFHSVVFDENRDIIAEEAAKIGQKASHGCIRTPLEDAKWIYNTIPKGTLVIVQD